MNALSAEHLIKSQCHSLLIINGNANGRKIGGQKIYIFVVHTDKSFYALEYTGQDFSEDEEVEEEDADAYLDTLAFDDYSKIIQELQSHRKEIEKLQTDMGHGGLRSLLEEEDPKASEQTEGNQGSEPRCLDLFGARVSTLLTCAAVRL